ncbi:MAG: TIGR02678 family protein [Planctomycetota bacterium]
MIRTDDLRGEERRKALRALLLRPVLLDDIDAGAIRKTSREATFVEESFVLVRRHAGYLGDWFARHTGWTLIVRSDSARLVKRPVETHDTTRCAVDPGASAAPLSRERYVLWCLLLTILHEEGRQSTLRHLAEKTVGLATAMPEIRQQGIDFDLKSASTRRGIVSVIRLAIRYGVLRRVGGDEERFAQNASVDCLYNINPALLTDLLMLPTSVAYASHTGDPTMQGTATGGSLDDLLDPFDEEMRPRQLEQRLIRRMIDDPVMYFEDLTEAEYQYFQSQRSRLFDVIENATGLVPELRDEGVAMLDPIGDLTDVKMPDSGTDGHATLLIAEFLGCSRSTSQQRTISTETLVSHLSKLATEHAKHWRKGITDLSQIKNLLDECLKRLEMLRMIRRTRDGGVVALPAIHRFIAESPRVLGTDDVS